MTKEEFEANLKTVKVYFEKDLPFDSAYYCECHEGWYRIIWQLIYSLVNKGWDGRYFMQIKEKFGALRVYVQVPEHLYHFVDNAESRSRITCEICGDEGRLCRTDNWLKTRCDFHEFN